MNGRTRIVVTGLPAAGHVNPSLPLVGELTRRGTEVRYYADEGFRAAVERTGAEFRAYPPGVLTAEDMAEATRTGSPLRVVRRVLGATETLVPFLLEELRADRPAAVAFDSTAVWGRISAAELGLPMISLMTTIMIGDEAFDRRTPPERLRFVRTAPDVLGMMAAQRRVVRRFGARNLPPNPLFPPVSVTR